MDYSKNVFLHFSAYKPGVSDPDLQHFLQGGKLKYFEDFFLT